MRCKKCGIQLSANNLDDCPNCGTFAEQGRRDKLPKVLLGGFFFLPRLVFVFLGFAALVSVLLYLATKSATIAGVVFLVMLGIGAFGFLGLLDFGG